MDIKEAEAMTEASGLTDQQDRPNQTTSQRSGSREKAGAVRSQLNSPSLDAATRWADQLREMAARAPLRSLLVAFLAGAWIARRR
jgi:hypothetical protein